MYNIAATQVIMGIILLDALKILKLNGARNVIIDWTVFIDFNGQFGFTPWKIYKDAYRSLL